MEDKKILLDNIAKIHTTEMGVDRIKRNLKIDTVDVVEYCKNKMLDKNCNIYKQGKNWYCEVENIKITINSYSYTIITHILLSKSQFVKLNIVSDKDDRNYKLSSFFIHRKELLKCIGYEVLLKN